MQKEIKISLIQGNPVTGDIAGNLRKAILAIHGEMDNDAQPDLIVFSECFISGYPVQDLVSRPGFVSEVNEALSTLREEVIRIGGPAVLIGMPQQGNTLPYNSAVLIEVDGSVRAVHKTELPNTDVFDERRNFASAQNQRKEPVMFRGFRLGIQVCEDMWHGDVSRSLADELADVLIVLNGSPYQRGKDEQRKRNAAERVRATGLPLIYVNQVGGQDELVFDGGSFTMNTDGSVMQADFFFEDRFEILLAQDEDGKARIRGVETEFFDEDKYNPQGMEGYYQACVLGLRDYVAKTGSERVIVGVSGGLDSAIVLTMAADAIGPENVIGVMMPSQHTSKESLDLADDLMTRLGVVKENIMISEAYYQVDEAVTDTAERIADKIGTQANMGVTRENFQARIRGVMLMGLSNAIGGIVLSTGNKSELAVGYSTLYGDMVGGFNPIKSVYKSEAFRMAEWRNSIDELRGAVGFVKNPIPEGIITRPPSAELAPGQVDSNSLGEYDLLDAVLRMMIELRMSASACVRELEKTEDEVEFLRMSGLRKPDEYVEKIASMVRRAQYKRVQAPPGVKLNETDFGMGWRYPIAGKYSL